jgi:pyruvate dehydrogenase E1 component alpha subunit
LARPVEPTTEARQVSAVFILRRDGAALLQHRDDIPGLRRAGMWVPPGGGSDAGEPADVCARREIREETGYDCDDLHWLDSVDDDPGDGGPSDRLHLFWTLYDDRQALRCLEGQDLRFVTREAALGYDMPRFLFDLWDRALAAGASVLDLHAAPGTTKEARLTRASNTTVDSADPGFHGDVDKKALYRRLLLLRRTEERIVAEYPKYEMRSPPHIYMGQEAVAVGVCAALAKRDSLFPYYRSHGWYLAKGGDIRAMIAELHGRTTGCSGGWGGSMHLIDLKAGIMGTSAIVAGTISHAVGAALAFKAEKSDAIAVACFGDAGTEEGVFHEALNFAALHKLPMVFICENNLYATNTHIRFRQALPNIYRFAATYGIHGSQADGNDVLKVHAEASRAVARARQGEGPSLLEFPTYRYLVHCGVFDDYDLGYRTADEANHWKARDPLLKAQNLVTPEERERMETEIRQTVDDAFEFARKSPFPASLSSGVMR